MSRLGVGLATACALGALAVPAAAESVDGATYQRLLAAAPADPSALARLRGVTVVDGRPVELRRALSGSSARVRARLEALRAPPPARPQAAAAARRTAAAILAGPEYRERREGWLARALSWLAGLLRIPSGANGAIGLIVLGAALAAVAGLVALLVGIGAAGAQAGARARARGRGARRGIARAPRSSIGEPPQRRRPGASRMRCACGWPQR